MRDHVVLVLLFLVRIVLLLALDLLEYVNQVLLCEEHFVLLQLLFFLHLFIEQSLVRCDSYHYFWELLLTNNAISLVELGPDLAYGLHN